MILFGWGRKKKSWSLGDGRTILATWGYFSIFFCPIAGKVAWHILGENRSEDEIISYEKVQALIPEGTPSIGVWSRFGLLIAIGLLMLSGLIFGQN